MKTGLIAFNKNFGGIIMDYNKKPLKVLVHQWFGVGDENNPPEGHFGETVKIIDGLPEEFILKTQEQEDCNFCFKCSSEVSMHGLIINEDKTSHVICPGDWIILKPNGRAFPLSDDAFRELFEGEETEIVETDEEALVSDFRNELITKKVESSNIASVGYDQTKKSLFVNFKNGSEYRYNDVPEDVFEELIGSESVGAFLNKQIKNIYEYEKIEPKD